jgi:hypothetical protein
MSQRDAPAETPPATAGPSVPTEFIEFLRRTGIGAFDRFAVRIGEPVEGQTSGPLQALASVWREMTKQDKDRFFDQLIAGGAILAAAATPVVVRAASKSVRRTAARRAAASTKVKEADTEAGEPKKDKKKKKKTAEEKAKKKAKKVEKKLKKDARKSEKKLRKKSVQPSTASLPPVASPS